MLTSIPRDSIKRRIRSHSQQHLLEALESRTLFSVNLGVVHVSPHQTKKHSTTSHANQSPVALLQAVATALPPAAPVVADPSESATVSVPVLDAPLAPTISAPSSSGASVSVVGRYVYYGGTSYFGDALATDKSVLLPGSTATSANVTSYTGGINELVIDVSNAATTYSASDFTFRVGLTGDAYSWATGPTPTSVSVVAGGGAGGTTRVYIHWDTGAIQNEWLQATFTPANDTFYLGNLVADTGSFQVTTANETDARSNTTTFLSPASITSTYDFNRDGRVDALDQLVARAANGASLPVLSAPLMPVTAASYDWHTQIIGGILNIWAPNPGDFGSTFTVTDPTMLFGADGVPQITALHQGPIADCYFLAAAGAIANVDPARIQALVKNEAGGGWAVTFQYLTGNSYVPVVVHTSNQLSLSLQTIANNEVWAMVLEKAYAAFRTWNGTTSQNTMASLNWGFGGAALTALGDTNNAVYIGSMSEPALYSTLQNDIAAGLPILYQTSSTAPTMVQSHVYIITGVSTDVNGTRWITTYNPWGFYDTRTEADLMANGIGMMSVGAH